MVRTQTLVHLQAGGAQTKDFGAVSQTDLTRSLVSPVAQANFNFNTALQETLKIYGYNPGQNLWRQIAKMPIFSCHPGKN